MGDRTAVINKYDQNGLKEKIAQYIPRDRVPKTIRIKTDTTDFFRINYNDVLLLDERMYLIRNYEKEGRFGIDEQPKFWVVRAIDLSDGEKKIIKMVFHEKFTAKVGDITFECIRSSRKEARILEFVRGHPNFMQGFSTEDSAGNIVRVIDYIPGKSMADHVMGLGDDHEDYLHNHFPSVLDDFIEMVWAIKMLHDHGEKHGDIRRDHIIKDSESRTSRWIDFDYNYFHRENMFGYDLFGLGNIIIFLAGRGDITTQYLKKHDQAVFARLNTPDLNIIFNNRVVNLKKVFPYIPDTLNRLLLHFSMEAETFYDNTEQFLNDLLETREELSD
jgi:serine/threonine protein kinase